jgi:hypothetical protein
MLKPIVIGAAAALLFAMPAAPDKTGVLISTVKLGG